MKQIEIVFSKSTKRLPIASWLIRWWTKKEYSHCAMRFYIKGLDSFTYMQASEGLVNYMSETQFLKKHEIVYKYKLFMSEDVYREMRKAAHEEMGAPYGTLQNLGIFLYDICRRLGCNKFENPWKRGRNCSELLYVHILSRFTSKVYDPNVIKPHEIQEILDTLEHPEVRVERCQ